MFESKISEYLLTTSLKKVLHNMYKKEFTNLKVTLYIIFTMFIFKVSINKKQKEHVSNKV